MSKESRIPHVRVTKEFRQTTEECAKIAGEKLSTYTHKAIEERNIKFCKIEGITFTCDDKDAERIMNSWPEWKKEMMLSKFDKDFLKRIGVLDG